MKPYSISASSLDVAAKCMARYLAENVNRTPRLSNDAADLGTTCHSALETYVKQVYMDCSKPPSKTYLQSLFKLYYTSMFDSNYQSELFKDGTAMMNNWYSRSYELDDVTVLSVEKKDFFEVPTPDNSTIKFNYIWDRADRLGDGGIKVVDYKSVRAPISADDMRSRIQPRAYALAAAIQFKDEKPDYILVEFDLLRYGTVGARFTREDNTVTWNYIKELTSKIYKTAAGDVKETLNSDCGYCVRKSVCKTLNKHTVAGGVLGAEISVIAQRKENTQNALKALMQLNSELDNELMRYASELGMTYFETDDHEVDLSIKVSRSLAGNTQKAASLVPVEVLKKYGKIGVSEIDKIEEDGEVDDVTLKQLKGLIAVTPGDPKIKVKPKSKF